MSLAYPDSRLPEPIAWGARVSADFRNEVRFICRSIGIHPNWLMACMAFETGLTFSPSIRNAAGSGAVGLIQFMPQTAGLLGTTTAELEKMAPEGQLRFVKAYFWPYKGRLASIEDTYMAILWPAAIGKPPGYVLFDKRDVEHPKRYVQNAELDYNRDGQVTKLEAADRVRRMMTKGLRPENMA